MTNLDRRTTRLIFKTGDMTRDKGKLREVIIEARPRTCSVRLSGLHTSYSVSYEAIYHLAVKQAVATERAEKAKGAK